MSTHLALPLRLAAGGRLATLPIGRPAEVAQSVAVLLATTVGERPAEPAYGVPDPLGAGFDELVARAAIARWEPRAGDVAITVDGVVDQAVTVTLQEGSAP